LEILILTIFFALMTFVALSVYFFVYRKIIEEYDAEPLKVTVERLEILTPEEAAKNFNRKFLEVTGKVSRIKYDGNKYIMTLGKDFKCYFKYANFPIVVLENEIIKVSGFYFDDGNLRGLKKCSV